MNEVETLAVERVGLAHDALAGRVAVVTGGGRGIGREIVRAFAWLGARVVIAELSDEGLETERRVKESGSQALFARTDVSSEAEVAALARKTREAFGPVDILINNAILCPVAPVLEMDASLWDRVMAVNLRGAFLTCKAFLPDMVSRRRGVVVNMISTDAMPGLSAYIASKQGLTGFSQSLAAEVGRQGVRVVAFAPGMVDTPGIRGAAEGLAPQLGFTVEQFLSLSLHPAYEGLMPADHAAAATAYLAAALADEFHGETVTGYTVLERAGFIQTPGATPVGRAAPAAEPAPQPGADRTEVIRRAIALSQQLQEVIVRTDAEFNKLPVFVRPMARGGFKNKSGQSVQDWARMASKLTEQLKKVEAADAVTEQQVHADCGRRKELLGKLIVYWQEVPGETARFTKDADLLRDVAQQMAEREAVARSLISVLEAL